MPQPMRMSPAVATNDTQAKMENIRVQLFSARELYHAAFRHFFEAEDGFILERTARAIPENLEVFKIARPDLAIVDLALLMGDLPGVMKDVLIPFCHFTSVLLLLDQIDIPSLRLAITCGIHGYLLTSISLAEFRQALQVVVTGGRWLGHATMRPHFAEGRPSYAIAGDPLLRNLSQREVQILNYIARGQTTNEIAHSLSLSESSVRTYWQRVLTKLNALNKAEAIARSATLGLLSLHEDV